MNNDRFVPKVYMIWDKTENKYLAKNRNRKIGQVFKRKCDAAQCMNIRIGYNRVSSDQFEIHEFMLVPIVHGYDDSLLELSLNSTKET